MARSAEAIAAEYLDKGYRTSVRRNAVTALAAIESAESVRLMTRVALDLEEPEELREHAVERLTGVATSLRGEVVAEVMKSTAAGGSQSVAAYALLAHLRAAGFATPSAGSRESLRLAWAARRGALGERTKIFWPLFRAAVTGVVLSIALCLGALFLLSPSAPGQGAVFGLLSIPLLWSLPLAAASIRSVSPTTYLRSAVALLFETLNAAIIAFIPAVVLLIGAYWQISDPASDYGLVEGSEAGAEPLVYAFCLVVALAAVVAVRAVSMHGFVPFAKARTWPRGVLAAAAGIVVATALLVWIPLARGGSTADRAFVEVFWLLLCCGLPGLGLALAPIDGDAPRRRLPSILVTLAVLVPLTPFLIAAVAQRPRSEAGPIEVGAAYQTETRELEITGLPFRTIIEARFAQNVEASLNDPEIGNRMLEIHLARAGSPRPGDADLPAFPEPNLSRRLEPGTYDLEVRETVVLGGFRDAARLFAETLVSPYGTETAIAPDSSLTLTIMLNVDPQSAVLEQVRELLARRDAAGAVAAFEAATAGNPELEEWTDLDVALCLAEMPAEREAREAVRPAIEGACDRWVEQTSPGTWSHLRALDQRAAFHASSGDAARAADDLALVVEASEAGSKGRRVREEWLAELRAGNVPSAMTEPAVTAESQERVLAWGGFADQDEEFQHAVDILKLEVGLPVANWMSASLGRDFEAALAEASVLLIPEIEEETAALTEAAEELRPIAERFIERGGVVVILGASGMMTDFLREAGLIELESAGAALDSVVVREDGPLFGAVSEAGFPPPNATNSYSPAEGLELWAVDRVGDGVVVATRQGSGLVIAIGMDYYERSPGADDVLIAAVTMRSDLEPAREDGEELAGDLAAPLN